MIYNERVICIKNELRSTVVDYNGFGLTEKKLKKLD